jgi:hypothetical protein
MVKSNTIKKYDNLPDSISDYGYERVSEWTKRELAKLQEDSDLPLAVPLQNGGYMVATYKIDKISASCWKVGNIEFTDKRTAIYHCALTHMRMYSEAEDLFEVDQRVNRYELDKTLFRQRLDNAHSVGDQFKIDLYSSRYENAKQQFSLSKQELEKILSKAKYNKIHGNQYET